MLKNPKDLPGLYVCTVTRKDLKDPFIIPDGMGIKMSG
jgi:hypothetical protein